MSQDDTFRIKFWGVRGSVPCPGPTTVRYGGNTTCMEINCGDRRIIIDAGTGIRELGINLIKKGGKVEADLLFTHTHLDHVNGFPFFGPFYNPNNHFKLYAGHLKATNNIENVLKNMIITEPMFPVPASVILGSCEFVDFSPNDTLDLGDGITVVTAPLNHPNGACGYRVEYKGHAIAIVTDTEHYEGKVDENVLKLAKDADIMVYDSAYTDEEYPKFKGWGHSTWQEALKVAEAANVTKTVLFHHDPSHDDNYMDEIAEISGAARFGTEPAREGMVIKVNI